MGKIAAVDFDDDVKSRYLVDDFERVIDATGQCVLPGPD